MACLRRSVRLSPGHAWPRVLLAEVLHSTPGGAEAAAAQLEAAAVAEPRHAATFATRGRQHLAAGRLKEAAKCAQRAVRVEREGGAPRWRALHAAALCASAGVSSGKRSAALYVQQAEAALTDGVQAADAAGRDTLLLPMARVSLVSGKLAMGLGCARRALMSAPHCPLPHVVAAQLLDAAGGALPAVEAHLRHGIAAGCGAAHAEMALVQLFHRRDVPAALRHGHAACRAAQLPDEARAAAAARAAALAVALAQQQQRQQQQQQQ